MSQKPSFLRRLSEKIDMPSELLPREGQIILSGSREVSINGHAGVGTYSTEEIRVRLCRGWVVVSGQKLEIARMNPVCVMIRGRISGVSLEGME